MNYRCSNSTGEFFGYSTVSNDDGKRKEGLRRSQREKEEAQADPTKKRRGQAVLAEHHYEGAGGAFDDIGSNNGQRRGTLRHQKLAASNLIVDDFTDVPLRDDQREYLCKVADG
ncbi:hypothetical protein KSP39_PZI004186 [Platanthera zijinensis]|uniref:Uncharacterized protein n=1 Tax=Platanthera zijinensis TaxID=2320716 RepID=A0AAP0BVS0_9ASPA